jgi:cytochrome c-type biogenesis protein CcmH
VTTRRQLGRREFLASVAASMAIVGVAGGQQGAPQVDAQGQTTQGNLFDMDQGAFRPVTLPPKPGAAPSMSDADRDTLEHSLRCMCGCTLDVYTCRTTDFSCAVSPAMHRDVMALVTGGHGARDILDAFVGRYGERVLMSPVKEGFNWLGYLAPFLALGSGAVLVAALIRRWGARAARAAPVAAAGPAGVDASPEELARLNAAVRDDG